MEPICIEGNKPQPPEPEKKEEMQPGFCSMAPVDMQCLQEEIKTTYDVPKTSDLYTTCNLPKRFEYPHWFNGYGCQMSKQHPFYRTTSNEYGWYAPGVHSVPSTFYPAGQKFTNALAAAGMYRNYSLNTGMDTGSFKAVTGCNW